MNRHARRAFTLIELLVVIAIIALLIGILLPSLSAARDAGRTIVCASNARSLAQAQVLYATENKDYIAGYMSSGKAGVIGGAAPTMSPLLRNPTPTTPTSSYDWISPVIGEQMGFSPDRPKRTQHIFNRFRCPNAKEINKALYGGAPDRGSAADPGSFAGILASSGGAFRQVSYLSPSGFHNPSPSAGALGTVRQPPPINLTINLTPQFNTPVQIPSGYEPRLDKVGNAANKVLVMDGTRYFSFEDGGYLDFDIDVDPTYWGSFVDNPGYASSAAYGRFGRANEGRAPGDFRNVKLSMRHGTMSMNAAFFDGSSRFLKSDAVYSRIDYWYPSGSKFTRGAVGTIGGWGANADCNPEAAAQFPANSILP